MPAMFKDSGGGMAASLRHGCVEFLHGAGTCFAKRRARDSAKSPGDGAGADDGCGSSEAAKPDGRACKICSKKDSDTDPIDGKFSAWYYSAVDGASQGYHC